MLFLYTPFFANKTLVDLQESSYDILSKHDTISENLNYIHGSIDRAHSGIQVTFSNFRIRLLAALVLVMICYQPINPLGYSVYAILFIILYSYERIWAIAMIPVSLLLNKWKFSGLARTTDQCKTPNLLNVY